MESQILKTDGFLTAEDSVIVCRFSSPRLVLSTSLFNGGFLLADAVFNKRLDIYVDNERDLPGGSMEHYLSLMAQEQNLDKERSTGLLTAAHMSSRGYSMLAFKGVIVEVVATAGVEVNAVRAGESARYYETTGGFQSIGGTINILVFTNVKLSQGTMAKALVSITEAKTAALQELKVVNPFTLQLATGTGTDGIILGTDPNADILLQDAGTQAKFGELLCRATKNAIKQSLSKECSIDSWREKMLERRLWKLGINEISSFECKQMDARSIIMSAMCQAVWEEYCWGLLGVDEVWQFLSILEMPQMQPFGTMLSKALRQKMSATYIKERNK